MPALLAHLLSFGRALRRLGLDVHVGRMLDVVEALRYVDLGRRDDVYHVCRALLVHRHEDLAVFDRAFERFWAPAPLLGGETPPASPAESGDGAPAHGPDGAAAAVPVEDQASIARDEADGAELRPVWSDVETLASKDFADFTAEEQTAARAALDRLIWRPDLRRTRRWTPGRGARLDLRGTLARSVRTGGDIVRLRRRARRLRPRPLVLLCDISGSMEGYSRMLLQFAHALAHRHRRVEAFLFSTRLTRITPQLRSSRVDDAVTAVGKAVPDWSGGTRIGAALVEFQRRWGRRALAGGPVVLLISDGWDRGEPEVLRDAVARLHRSCHRLIWLNPLIGTRDYQPLTRGLVAALPHVDEFLPARSLRDIAQLAELLDAGKAGKAGRAGKGAPS
jgi:uncharacterized protein with von Willebrand factor type A (vWA) domain